MYKVNSKSEKGFIVKANTLDFSYLMDRNKEYGTTPVGHLVVALSGCAIMCIRGYYIKKGLPNAFIEAELKYENSFEFDIKVDQVVDEVIKEEIIAYIKKYCTVSQMLDKDIEIKYNITGK